ncbi:MAG: chorismate synthase [Spirochaetes bacterium]|nr:chorismate synthase [Spirochaetota bacterium]
MAANTFGRVFCVTTFGESHGYGVGAVVDGVPPGLSLDASDIQKDLERRRPGKSGVSSARREPDRVEIVSGVFEGRTTGTPLLLFLKNEDVRSRDYEKIKNLYRPGHADYTYDMKFGVRDWRGGGRASGRETAARVAAGAVAKTILEKEGITITAYTVEIAGVRVRTFDSGEIDHNPVFAPDGAAAEKMVSMIESARKEGDSVGGMIEVSVLGCPPGVGEPVFDKLDALFAHAIMSIGGVKSVEIGCGIGCARMRGSVYNDPFVIRGGRIGTKGNNCGGILGGISTGERILLKAAVHPTPSIARTQDTVTEEGKPVSVSIEGRHDPCIVPRVVPVAEAMVACVLADCLLLQRRIKKSGG